MASFSDDFNRGDSSSLGAGWVEVSGDWSIISTQLSPGSTGGTILLRAAGAMASSDHFAQVTIAATASASQGVWCRGNLDLTSGYLWRNNGSSWNLFSVVGEEFSFIGSYAAAASPGDVAGVQAVGSTIKAFVNGVERVSVTDTAVPTGTTVGVRSDAVSSIRYDSFSAGDITAAGTGTADGVFGGLAGAASGVRKVSGSAASSHGGLTGAANGTRKVVGTAALAGGPLAGNAAGVRTVAGSAAATFGGLAGSAVSPSLVTGFAGASYGGLIGRATVLGTQQADNPGGAERSGLYGLLDILHEGAQLAREDRERTPAACPDCGEPLRSGPGGQLYCSFDGSTWGVGGRRTGHVSVNGGR
ncbi:hypothetical protein AB0I66_21655 [Streptomyces sp. NPDC050439]|uniref:hypothetical protein n=1 Tax=unclassified Streptomyces TaxID=2593676 RepID=UPI00341DFBA5